MSDAILEAIRGLGENMNSRFNSLETRAAEDRETVDDLTTRVTSVESDVAKGKFLGVILAGLGLGHVREAWISLMK